MISSGMRRALWKALQAEFEAGNPEPYDITPNRPSWTFRGDPTAVDRFAVIFTGFWKALGAQFTDCSVMTEAENKDFMDNVDNKVAAIVRAHALPQTRYAYQEQ